MTKELIKEAIILAIDSLRENIRDSRDPVANLTRAQAIKELTQAYCMVSKTR